MIASKGNMKSKHILLFIVSCALLYISDFFAGSLIALALLYQLNLLYKQIPLTKQSQIAAFKLFICAIPLFFFFGAIHSFISLYFAEAQWLFLIFAFIVCYFLCFLVYFFTFFVFKFLVASQFNISATYQTAFMEIKNEKKDLFLQTFFILIFSFVPYLTTEWKIIFSLTVIQAYLHRSQLKQVVGF